MGTVTLIRSLLLAALAGLGTFALVVLLVIRPEIESVARYGESAAFFLYLVALPAAALFVMSMVIALVGFVSGRVLPGDMAGSHGWCTGGGKAGTAFAW